MCGVHYGGKENIEFLLKKGFKFEYFVIMNPEQAKTFNISGYYDYTDIAKKMEYQFIIQKPTIWSIKMTSIFLKGTILIY